MPNEPRAGAEEEGWEELGGVSAHAWRSQADADAIRERIRPYLDRHRDQMAGRWLQWDGDNAVVVVAFTEDVDRHRAALEPLGVRVVLRQYRESELQTIAWKLFEFAGKLDGVVVHGCWSDPIEGKAVVEAVTKNPDGLLAVLRAEHGELAELEWLGPDEYVRRTVEFDAYEIAGDDRTLTVGWDGGVPEPEPLVIDESDDRVLVTASERTPVGAIAAVGMRRTATAALEEPLAGRSVVDATTGRDVPRGRAAVRYEAGPGPEELAADLLRDAMDLVAGGADAAALELFAQLAAQQPQAFDDPTVVRKRRLAELRLKRSTDADGSRRGLNQSNPRVARRRVVFVDCDRGPRLGLARSGGVGLCVGSRACGGGRLRRRLWWVVRAELNDLLCADVPGMDLRCWDPQRGPGAVLVEMLLGSVGDGGGESFSIMLCTPEWISQETRAVGIFNASHYLVVADFDYNEVEEYLTRKVSACQGETWQEVADQLRTFSHWEFEGYKDRPASQRSSWFRRPRS